MSGTGSSNGFHVSACIVSRLLPCPCDRVVDFSGLGLRYMPTPEGFGIPGEGRANDARRSRTVRDLQPGRRAPCHRQHCKSCTLAFSVFACSRTIRLPRLCIMVDGCIFRRLASLSVSSIESHWGSMRFRMFCGGVFSVLKSRPHLVGADVHNLLRLGVLRYNFP